MPTLTVSGFASCAKEDNKKLKQTRISNTVFFTAEGFQKRKIM
jgi:hypothetical protein